MACNKILILAAQKRRNAEQFRHSGFDSLCCICHQTPGKSGLSGLVAVHAYPCIGAKDSLILACDISDTPKKKSYGWLSHLEMHKQCLPNSSIFFLKLLIIFKVGGQYRKRGDKSVIPQLYQFPLSSLWNQWQNHIEVAIKVSLWDRIKKALEDVGRSETSLRIWSWQNLNSCRKLKVQVQIVLWKLCRKGCSANGVHKRWSPVPSL